MIKGIPSAEVLENLRNIEPFFRNFADRSDGRWSVESLLDDVLNRQKQVWKVNDWQALCLTTVGAECVEIIACAGVRRLEWQDELRQEIEAWARAIGKARVFAIVRPGWAKFLKAEGYREKHREMLKEL